MDVKAMTKEDLLEVPLVEIAFELMKDEGKPFNYYDLFNEIVALKGLNKQEAESRIAKLYTDINIDGRFHSLGDNQWGLKKWYPLEQTQEEITTPIKRRKKKSADDDEADIDFEDYEDEFEDLEDELDEVIDEDEEEGEDIAEAAVDEEDFDEKDDLDGLDEDELDDEEFDDEDDID